MKGFIVYSDYELIEEETFVKFFGRLENGQSFATINKIEPYFFIREEDLKKISKYLEENDCKTEKTALANFKGEKVIKISAKNYRKLNEFALALEGLEIKTYEADIKPHNRFIIDKDILGTIDIEGEYTTSEKVERVYQEPSIKPSFFKPNLKIASIDIETDKKSDKLYCIGIYTGDKKLNFMITKEEKLKNVVPCSSEEDCLEKFKDALIKIDPDIITGWSLVDFDFKFLQKLFKKYKIAFDLGRDNTSVRLRIESNFFRSSTADIAGRQVLDGLNMIKDPFLKEAPSIKNYEFESYTLEDVSQVILGNGKLIKGKGRHEEITRLYEKKEHQKLADYNLMDCELVYNILQKTDLITLAIERSQLTGMPLDRISASIAAFDSLYIREARKKGLVSQTMSFKRKEEKIKGAYVFSSKPGIYHNVAILDFKSLYPSVIRTFNIDPSSMLEKYEKNSVESPNKVYFKNADGILPGIIEKLHHEREKAKKEKREFASYALKTTMNSFWGVLASPNCRYFNFDMANAITSFCRWIIQLTAKKIEEKGYKVIYSDTDSVFVETGLGKEKANTLGIEIQDYINKFYKDYIKENYSRDSVLELEFDKQYTSMMIPKVRTHETLEEKKEEKEGKAAKKRYAGLIEENGKQELEMVGLEAIRGDWTEAAQEFQRELLLKLFKNEPPEKFIKEYIKKIVSGKMDEKLIYKKSIRKSLDEYTKITPPHVKAARQLDKIESNIIQYYITEAGPEPIQKLKHKIDYEHYLKKQIEPIANQVLSLFDKSFDDIVKNSKQSTLF